MEVDISVMRMIKLFAWEPKVEDQIFQRRQKELRLIAKGPCSCLFKVYSLLNYKPRQDVRNCHTIFAGSASLGSHARNLRYVCKPHYSFTLDTHLTNFEDYGYETGTLWSVTGFTKYFLGADVSSL